MPPIDQPSKPTLQYGLLYALLTWALLAQLTISAFGIYLQATSADRAIAPFVTRSETAQILHYAPGYEHTGLQIGDEIVALNREPVRGTEQFGNVPFSMNPGDMLMVTVHRFTHGGWQTLDVPVKLHGSRSNALSWVFTLGLYVILPLSCTLVGFYIAFARPRDPLAWITLGMLASFGQLVGVGSGAIWPPWREIFLVYHSLLNNLWPAWMVLFAFYFPVPFPFIQKRRWLNGLVLSPFLAFAAVELYEAWQAVNRMQQIRPVVDFMDRIENPARVLIGCYISAFFILLGFKNRVLTTPDARRRMAVLMAGCSLALTPVLLLILSEIGVLPPFPFWLVTVCLLMLVFFPITMAYVIVVQRAMDVRIIVRSGVRYTLASTGVKVLRIVLIGATIALCVNLATRSHNTAAAILIGIGGVILVSGLRRVTARASRWMDRRFFREAYNVELVLTELSRSVSSIRDTKALLETVARRIADSLHVSRIAMLLERGNFYQPAYALGYGTLPAVELDCNAATVRFLKTAQAPARVYFDDPQSWVYSTPEQEQTALHTLGAQVLLPVSLNTRLLGVISLGPKRSEAPYSRADLHLLTAVASQTGLALENAQLTESIRREIAQRERVDRELEIAREVQQRLFPQNLPHIKGLEFAGYCRPALGVGGDYYDFVHLDDGSLGIAIGDVSGKGIAAALMMASLQASLRGQTITPGATLSEMIQHVNRLVYEASAENRYATFFYAQYDPNTRLLRYVNAGHNPPILYRNGGGSGQIFRLEEGGTVIGVFRDAPYMEGSLQLGPGDTLVAFTDGISEAMTTADDEFGEQRLVEAIRECGTRWAADMISFILKRVDAFTSGAPQHDDMTLVIVRVE